MPVDLNAPELYLVLSRGGESRNIFVEDLRSIKHCFNLHHESFLAYMNYSIGGTLEAEIATTIDSAEAHITNYDTAMEKWEVYPVSAKVAMISDGETVQEKEIDLDFMQDSSTEPPTPVDDTSEVQSLSTTYFTIFEHDYTERPDSLEFIVTIVDNNGREYTQVVDPHWN